MLVIVDLYRDYSMARESNTWAKCSRRWHGLGQFVRIEAKSAGVPDVCWTSGGRSGWLELKCSPVGLGPWYADLRAEQAVWLGKWSEAGGLCGVLVECSVSGRWALFSGSGLSYYRQARRGLVSPSCVLSDPDWNSVMGAFHAKNDGRRPDEANQGTHVGEVRDR